jgi:beta-N-acetylhexosaminidase
MLNENGAPFFLTRDDIRWVEGTLQSLTTEQKVGQLFVVVDSPFNRRESVDLLSIEPGGIHVFAEENKSKESQHAAIALLQSQSKLPLLISGDLESGGQGGTLEGTNFASNMQVGAANDPQLSQAFGSGIEREGIAMGFNWVFGPVVDINYNYQNPIVNTRAFGDAPDLVAKHAVPVLQGIQERRKMAACVKHWPGDGMDDRDQHKVLTLNSMSMSAWRESYGKVYRQAIEAGVKTVMSAHIALPAYYEELGITDIRTMHTPGSLSYELNTHLLRGEYGFNGLIVSDATSMLGMDTFGPRSKIVPQCIASGVDMFLFTRDMQYDYEAMLQGVRDGIVSEERLNEAVTRILGLKASLGLHNRIRANEPTELEAVGCPEHRMLAVKLAQKAATLIKDTQSIIPLTPEKHKRILLIAAADANSMFGDGGSNGVEFEQMLTEEGFEVTREYTLKETDQSVDAVIYLIKRAPGFLESSLRMTNAQSGGLFTWYPTRIPTIFISLGSPYVLYEMPSMPTVVNAYNSTITVQREVLNALLGKQPFQGQSPVDAFCGLDWARL